MKYKVKLFYARPHQPEFNTKEDAMNYLRARALTKKAMCISELWEMSDEENGELVATFDYGCKEPLELVLKK